MCEASRGILWICVVMNHGCCVGPAKSAVVGLWMGSERRDRRTNIVHSFICSEETERDDDMDGDEDEVDDIDGIDIGPTQFGGRDGAFDPSYDGVKCAACGRGEESEAGRVGGGFRPQRKGASGAGGGGMIACDGGCDRTFHLRCVGLRSVPAADWICGDCSAAPSPEDDDEGEDWRAQQRPSQRRRAALQSLHQKNWA